MERTGVDKQSLETARKKSREILHKAISDKSHSEMLEFLEKKFKCEAKKGGKHLQIPHFKLVKSFFGKACISNRCQFQPASEVDLKHIIGYCCNEYYEACPIYQVYLCSNALMHNITHK